MTEKEIREGNILIAEFLGSRYIDDAPEDYPNGYYFQPEGLEENCPTGEPEEWLFNSSWDWIMPVIEKIAQLPKAQIMMLSVCGNYKVNFSQYQLSDTFQGSSHWPMESFIEATYKAVIEFIKWYNEQNR